MATWILKISWVDAAGTVARPAGNSRAGLFHLPHNGVNFFSATRLVTNRAFGGGECAERHVRVKGTIVARIHGELQPMLEVEQREGAMLELRADNSLRRQSSPIG
jgi:hypothetical protein